MTEGRIGRALLRFAPFALGTLIVAGIVHIVAVLVAPTVASRTAAARLAADRPVNELSLPAGQPLPFADPAAVAAACPFDIEEGPVRLRVPTGEGFLSVTVLSPTGRVLLSLTDRAATRRQLNIVLATAEQQRQLEAQDPEDEPLQEVRIRLAERRGVAVVRALALRESERPALVAQLARGSCRQE